MSRLLVICGYAVIVKRRSEANEGAAAASADIYEWFLSSTNAAPRVLPHCTGNTCTIRSLRATDDGRAVFCIVRGTEGMSARSDESILAVESGLQALGQAFSHPEVLMYNIEEGGGMFSVLVGVVMGALLACGGARVCCSKKAVAAGYKPMESGGD